MDPTTSVIARSARLVVRQFAPGDLDDLVELHNDPAGDVVPEQRAADPGR